MMKQQLVSSSKKAVAGLALLALAPACGGVHRFATLEGACFDVTVGWHDLRRDSLELLPPPRVRLDTTVARTGSPRRRVTEAPGTLPSIHWIASWREIAPDSLEMGWSTGFAGVILRLPMSGDTLRGVAESFYDAGEGSRAPAMAVHIPCSAPVPPAFRRRRSSPLTVPLLDGMGALQRIPRDARSWWQIRNGRGESALTCVSSCEAPTFGNPAL
jgi:hypothetical protein